MAAQSGLGHAERGMWPKGHPPGHLVEMGDVSGGLWRVRR